MAGPVRDRAHKAGDHVRELDGVRALAIWGVLISHLIFAVSATPAGHSFIPQPLVAIFGHTWLGVDLFFVLSGYLITGILLAAKQRGRSTYFRQFYLRRSLRIWPLYFIVLAVLCFAYGTHYTTYLTLCAVFVANLTPAAFPVPDAAGPMWSLAVEEQFYLIWPWLVLWLDRRRLMLVAIAVIGIELAARLLAQPQQMDLTWFRSDGLAMGALLAACAGWDNDRRAAMRLTFILLSAATAFGLLGWALVRAHPESAFSTTISVAVCCFGALVVVAVAFRGHRVLAVLRWRFAAFTASLSYAIYLVHMPIVDAWQAAFGSASWFADLAPSAQTLLRAFVVLGLSYAIALATRAFIESPVLRIGQKNTIAGFDIRDRRNPTSS